MFPSALLALCLAALQDSEKPVELLAKARAIEPAALADGNAATVAVEPAPFEVVIAFKGVVTPERLVVWVPKHAAAATRVEVLASTVSPDAGFVFVRADPLKSDPQPQSFPLPPTAARWVMLRFAGPAGGAEVAVADVSLVGREGPPRSRYEFSESPAKALELVAGLRGLAQLKIEISADETSLFEDAKDGKLDTWSFAEAALLASGVTEKERRAAYVARIDALVADARKATEGGKTAFEKGEQLLKWLHAGAMAKGYRSEQTDVSVILDTGTFNCVSSAALYNIIGRRLGLDLRAIEVPDHAFSILYDGSSHADVETTNAAGFNPSRDPRALKAFEAQTGFRYVPDHHRGQRREVDEAGLVAIIFYNHGVGLGRGKEHLKAILSYFRAMSLDPEFASAVKNALASLAQWSSDLAREGRHEEAVAVLETGVALAPRDPTLVHNRRVAWSEWAEAHMRAGREDEALAVLRRAAEKAPAEAAVFASMQAGLFIRRGEELVKARAWEKALEVGSGSKLDDKPRAEMESWRSGVRTRWALDRVEARAHAEALTILAAGPRDRRTVQNIDYVVQEWAAASTEEEARKVLREQVKRFEDLPGVKRVAVAHAERLVGALRKAGKHEEAVACAERHTEFLREMAGDADRLLEAAYDGWGLEHAKARRWSEAAGVYEKALRRMAGNQQLLTNFKYVAQEWSRDAYAKEGEARALEIVKAHVERFPDVARGHVLWVVQSLCKAGKYEDAAAAVGRHSGLIKEPAEAGRIAYDQWARSHSSKKEWKEATEAYGRGLREYPGDRHLENNAAVVWDNWARTYFAAKDWDSAIQVYEEALKQVPKSAVLQNNLKYCREQAGK